MSVVEKKVRELVVKEVKYISNLFPYNFKKFLNPSLIHSQNVMSFINNDSPAASVFSSDFLYKLTNLLAGIELTAIGINMHSFNANDFMLLTGNKKFGHKNEKSYTLDLLFGDIFYSRAVVYFMKYGDFLIFEEILHSLKQAHKSKLLFHQQLVEVINKDIIEINRGAAAQKNYPQVIKKYENQIGKLIDESLDLIIGINSLFKTSFIIGWGLFADCKKIKFPADLINKFIMIKAYNDLENFFNQLPKEASSLKKIKNISYQKNFIKSELNDIISNLKPGWLKANFKVLERSCL
ncbi:MAG: hypothetical protein M1365_16645 [Actinobacteria bacterium]|nr:hypothetical protein [Actinomycetota bacterium]